MFFFGRPGFRFGLASVMILFFDKDYARGLVEVFYAFLRGLPRGLFAIC